MMGIRTSEPKGATGEREKPYVARRNNVHNPSTRQGHGQRDPVSSLLERVGAFSKCQVCNNIEGSGVKEER